MDINKKLIISNQDKNRTDSSLREKESSKIEKEMIGMDSMIKLLVSNQYRLA